jgi:hypothetical protein
MPDMLAPPTQPATTAADIQALFAEARRRRRRRRIVAAGTALVLAGTAAGVLSALPSRDRPAVHPADRDAVLAGVPSLKAPADVVAWVDYSGQLHLGDLATLRQHVIADINAQGFGLREAAGRLFWQAGSSVWGLDLATGRHWRVAPGQWVQRSADGRQLYIAPSEFARSVLVMPATGAGHGRLVRLPAGWLMNDYPDVAVAGGIMVSDRHAMGILHTGTGRVQVIATGPADSGRAADWPIAAYTPAGASYSLLAWAGAAGCRMPRCIEITNTGSGRSVTVQSPLRWGFPISATGTFEPGRPELAEFVNVNNPLGNDGSSELAFINARTGAIRLDPKVRMTTTEEAAWAIWLPGGSRLLAGAIDRSFLVDPVTLASRQFYFDGGATPAQSIMTSPDLNFSTVYVPASALGRRLRGLLAGPPHGGSRS